MTRRERLEMVIRGELSEELVADCKRELEKLDQELMRLKETDHHNENREVENKIIEVLESADNPLQVGELADAIGCTFARQRLTAICTNLIREGRIKSVDVKTKNGKRKGYLKI